MMKVKERTNEIMDDEKKIDLAMYSHSRQYGKGSDLIMRDDSMNSLSGIGKASSRLQRQHQFNTFNIAKAEVERSFDFRLMKAKDSAACQVFLLLCTCWALLALDLTYLYLDKGVDDVVQVITFIVFLVFCAEFSLQLYLEGDHFLFSTLAVLDILAVLSMVIDIMPLFYEPERFSVENYGNGTLSETISVGSAELARAGRAAKSGSKMGRALRVVRIFRISKAFRSLDLTSAFDFSFVFSASKSWIFTFCFLLISVSFFSFLLRLLTWELRASDAEKSFSDKARTSELEMTAPAPPPPRETPMVRRRSARRRKSDPAPETRRRRKGGAKRRRR